MLGAILFFVGQILRMAFTGLGVYFLANNLSTFNLKSATYGECFSIAAALIIIHIGIAFNPISEKE